MDANRFMDSLVKYARAIGREDDWIKVETHAISRMGGKATARVQILTVISEGLDDELETYYFVVRNGNPDNCVLATQEEQQARELYAVECERADEDERIWMEDWTYARR